MRRYLIPPHFWNHCHEHAIPCGRYVQAGAAQQIEIEASDEEINSMLGQAARYHGKGAMASTVEPWMRDSAAATVTSIRRQLAAAGGAR